MHQLQMEISITSWARPTGKITVYLHISDQLTQLC